MSLFIAILFSICLLLCQHFSHARPEYTEDTGRKTEIRYFKAKNNSTGDDYPLALVARFLKKVSGAGAGAGAASKRNLRVLSLQGDETDELVARLALTDQAKEDNSIDRGRIDPEDLAEALGSRDNIANLQFQVAEGKVKQLTNFLSKEGCGSRNRELGRQALRVLDKNSYEQSLLIRKLNSVTMTGLSEDQGYSIEPVKDQGEVEKYNGMLLGELNRVVKGHQYQRIAPPEIKEQQRLPRNTFSNETNSYPSLMFLPSMVQTNQDGSSEDSSDDCQWRSLSTGDNARNAGDHTSPFSLAAQLGYEKIEPPAS